MELEIKTESYQPFDFSEYYLVKLPVFTFNIHSFTIGKPLTAFCIDLIYETIKNLVIARQLELSYTYPDKSYRTNGEKIDWFVKRITADLSPFSWLEQQIISAALPDRQKPLSEFIRSILYNCDKILNIQSRRILFQVASSSQSGLITTSISKLFLSKRLNITINETINLESFIKTEGQLGIEYLGNEKFKNFSDSLFARLKRQFINNQND